MKGICLLRPLFARVSVLLAESDATQVVYVSSYWWDEQWKLIKLRMDCGVCCTLPTCMLPEPLLRMSTTTTITVGISYSVYAIESSRLSSFWAGVAILWRPSPNTREYAYAAELAMDNAEDDDGVGNIDASSPIELGAHREMT